MLIFVCNQDVAPCPSSNQEWHAIAEVLDPAQFGITPGEILKVASWGFGFVLTGFLLGYGLGIALGLIKKV